MKQKITLATIKTEIDKGNVKLQVKRLIDAIHRAHADGAQLVQTHEYAVDGGHLVSAIGIFRGVRKEHKKEIEDLKRFYLESATKIKETYFPQFAELAAKLNIYIALGTPEAVSDGVYNSLLLFAPDGNIIARYRKVNSAFEVGTKVNHSFDVYSMPFGNIGGLVCADFGMSESWRILRLKGAQLVLFSSCGYTAEDWFMVNSLRTFAFHNGYFISWANHRSGMLIDPDGTIIARTGECEDILMRTIDLDTTKGKGLAFSRDLQAYWPLLDKGLQDKIAAEFSVVHQKMDIELFKRKVTDLKEYMSKAKQELKL